MNTTTTLKYTFLLLLAVTLFSSCTITQRRYTSGYSIEWKHKTPAVIVNKEATVANNGTSSQIERIPVKQIGSTITSPAEKLTAPKLKTYNPIHPKNITSSRVASNAKAPISNAVTINQGDKDKPRFYTGDEQEDDHASKAYYLVFSL